MVTTEGGTIIEWVIEAFKVILFEAKVKRIPVNLFGGIMKWTPLPLWVIAGSGSRQVNQLKNKEKNRFLVHKSICQACSGSLRTGASPVAQSGRCFR